MRRQRQRRRELTLDNAHGLVSQEYCQRVAKQAHSPKTMDGRGTLVVVSSSCRRLVVEQPDCLHRGVAWFIYPKLLGIWDCVDTLGNCYIQSVAQHWSESTSQVSFLEALSLGHTAEIDSNSSRYRMMRVRRGAKGFLFIKHHPLNGKICRLNLDFT